MILHACIFREKAVPAFAKALRKAVNTSMLMF